MFDPLTLPPIARQIYVLLKRRPRTVDGIIAQIWWMHPQDAPEREAIKAHIWALNKRLRGHHERVQHDGDELYRLVSTLKMDRRSKYMREYMRRYRSKGGQNVDIRARRATEEDGRGRAEL